MVLFGFSTGTKCEFRILKNKNYQFSVLVPVLNPKSTTFSPLVPVQRPQEIEEKNSKKVFLWAFVPIYKYLIFGPKNF